MLARASFGVWGANLPALVRAIVACFWYGAQTAAASGAIVALLIRVDAFMEFHKNTHFLGHSGLEVICYRRHLGAAASDHPERHGDGAQVPGLGRPGGLGDDADPVGRPLRQGRRRSRSSPAFRRRAAGEDQGRGIAGEPGSFWALMAVAATWVTYFAALYLNFCDFSRYAQEQGRGEEGNLWGLPVNLILFSLVAGVTTIAAFQVYGEVAASSRADLGQVRQLVARAACGADLRRGDLGHQRRGQFRLAGVRLLQRLPELISFKKGGYIAAGIALVLYPFAPWEGNASTFVNAIGATMGPLLGVILVDYYLIAKGRSTSRPSTERTTNIATPAAGTSMH